MQYDPTFSALIHPERQPPLGKHQPWNEAATIAECARLAYYRFESDANAAQMLKGALADFGYGDFTGFAAHGQGVGEVRFDTQAYGAVSAARTALIAFRGSQPDSFRDVLTNASVLPTAWAGAGKVHSGFWASLNEALPAIVHWLDKVKPVRLIVTGHSLGAAQASLLAGIRKDAELLTLGSPLVGDAAFVASFAGRRMARYVDCLDIVTRVPPALYDHLDGLQYIDRHGTIVPGGLDSFDSLAERVAANLAYAPLIRPGNCLLRNLADHAPINYVSAILGIRTGP